MARYLAHWQVGDITGPVVAIDVVRAFTTAAYAFGRGAREIHLAESLDDVYRLLDSNPDWLAMGESGGLRPERFGLSNSPVHASTADLDGRTIVQRTSAGTRGALAARRAEPLLCASLVVASATSAYLSSLPGGAAPTYVITGRFADDPSNTGDEDLAAAEYIEAVRRSRDNGNDGSEPRVVSRNGAIDRVLTSADARHTLTLGADHVHPRDIEYCVDIDRFEFAMVAERRGDQLVLRAVHP